MNSASRRGMILVIVLVVVSLCSMATIAFTQLMLAEKEASDISVRKVQARLSAESGVEMLRMFLAQVPEVQAQQGGSYHNPLTMQAALVNDAGLPPIWRSRFTVLSPLADEYGRFQSVRYGIEDESTKLNLNVLVALDQTVPGAGRQILMGLPGMTEDIADAILDWMDPDDEPREYGAEKEYYELLDPPYAPTNGPLTSVEELLLVKGVTPELLFGVDANHNGVADALEPDPNSMSDVDNSDGSMDRGWSAYLTLYSLEMNLQPDGVTPKINLNQTDMQTLYDQVQQIFGDQVATFVVAYRQYGPVTPAATPAAPATGWNQPSGRIPGGLAALRPASWLYGVLAGGGGGAAAGGGGAAAGGGGAAAPTGPSGPQSGQLDLTRAAKTPIKTVLDLVGALVRVTFQGQKQASVLASPFPDDPSLMDAYIPNLLDFCVAGSSAATAGTATAGTATAGSTTTGTSLVTPGRINVNQAPQLVLLGIPGMTPDMVDQIVAMRPMDPTQQDLSFNYETWLYSKGVVTTLVEMKALMPFVCTKGAIYRTQVVGYPDGEGPAVRIEVVIHSGSQPPRVIFWRDMSHLGRGYPLAILGIDPTPAVPAAAAAPAVP